MPQPSGLSRQKPAAGLKAGAGNFYFTASVLRHNQAPKTGLEAGPETEQEKSG
ncbi:hypothetical protein JCM17846_28080 [Iodidimonas nitroreducens]|uniref:Uncharacterized protein n=1 Tax=Iodidimonas nitroreducens TaxID=1236968 RepID=A0A5A7NDW0_9PROT|nr:hypothetical protein JCM17846_28080 [Iodidimonas nitroreducens]